MKFYDPSVNMVPEQWLAIDEAERIWLVERYHRKSKGLGQNAKLHAIVHLVVENQLAMADGEAARRALKRLMGEQVSRHGAIHAIGSVVAKQIFAIVKDAAGRQVFDHGAYVLALENLEAAEWRTEG